jgi:hypothetical protein
MPDWMNWRNFDSCLIRLAMLVAMGFVGFLVYLILSTRTSPTSDSESLIQMAQWTIVTVLTGGAALIGINWYQGEKRYERDREDVNKAVEELASNNAKQFQQLAEQIEATAFFTAVSDATRRVGSREDEAYIQKCIDLYQEIPTELTLLRDIIAGWMIDEAKHISNVPVSKVTRSRVDPLRGLLPTLAKDFPERGKELKDVLEFFEPNNHRVPEPES